MANYNRSSLVLSVNRALWGEVSATLRQVTATFTHGMLSIRFVFAGEPSPEDVEMAARVTRKAGSDFPELKPRDECIGSDEALTVEEGWNQIFRRRE